MFVTGRLPCADETIAGTPSGLSVAGTYCTMTGENCTGPAVALPVAAWPAAVPSPFWLCGGEGVIKYTPPAGIPVMVGSGGTVADDCGGMTRGWKGA
jgi:hypothetical protein